MEITLASAGLTSRTSVTPSLPFQFSSTLSTRIRFQSRVSPCSILSVKSKRLFRNELVAATTTTRAILENDSMATTAELDKSLAIKKKGAEISSNLKGTSIFLVGLNNSYKSNLGKSLADALGYFYFDSDSLVEEAVGGKSAALLSIEKDKEGYLATETEVFKQLSSMGRLVVSAGNGAVNSMTNLGLLRHGISVWIDVPLDLVASEIMEERIQLSAADTPMVLEKTHESISNDLVETPKPNSIVPEETPKSAEETPKSSSTAVEEARKNPNYKALWVQCESCDGLNYKKFLKEKMNICEHCGFHLKMNSSERIETLLDPGTWYPMDEDMVAIDAIGWDKELEKKQKVKSSSQVFDQVFTMYDGSRNGYATADATVSLQKIANESGYDETSGVTTEDLCFEVLNEIEKLLRKKKMMEEAAKPF